MNNYQPLPIGEDNFERLIQRGYYFVDKTLFIKDLLDKKGAVNLFTRPRRFGKSLNLSMLRYFFEDVRPFKKDNQKLFKGLKILAAGEKYREELGKYPVIQLSFKSVDRPNFKSAYQVLRQELADQYFYHDYLLRSEALTEAQKKQYQALRDQKAKENPYRLSLKFLSQCLFYHHKQKVIILIDEYDVPLEKAYFEEKRGEKDFYRQMSNFIRSLLEAALKTNEALEFAVLTGCLRITKEAIFTGLNNLKINSILSNNYDEYFGFTKVEVDAMFKQYNLEQQDAIVKKWYDGYRFGNHDVYNPWSVINFVDNVSEGPKAYWSNTSSNSIVKNLIEQADNETKREIEELIAGKTIKKELHEEITYADIDEDQDNLWNFLFFTGYLKLIDKKNIEQILVASLAIPNEEILYIYKTTVLSWFKKYLEIKDLSRLYQGLLSGETNVIKNEIDRCLMESVSFYDQGEVFYQGFLLGLLKSMPGMDVTSNRESGNGRYDILVKSQDMYCKEAIIIELKVASKYLALSETSQKALFQIQDKKYAEGLLQEDYKVIQRYGIAFFGKNSWVSKG